MTDTPNPLAPDEKIVCRVTLWFFRRLGLLALMTLGMGAYFFYDGKFGYPNENGIEAKKTWFETEYIKGFDEAKAAGKLDAWIAQAKKDGLPAGENGEPPKWATYAAQHGWPETPKHHGEEEIMQQYEWGGAMALVGVLVLLKILLDRGKTLTGLADRMIMPNGAQVPFADAFKVDKRKWEVKALATVHYRVNGAEKTAVIDDLKYDGAGRVLERLLANFNGELIEKLPEGDAAADTAAPANEEK